MLRELYLAQGRGEERGRDREHHNEDDTLKRALESKLGSFLVLADGKLLGTKTPYLASKHLTTFTGHLCAGLCARH